MPDNLQRERSHSLKLVFEAQLGLQYRPIFEDRRDFEVSLTSGSGLNLRLPDILFSGGEAGWPHAARRPPDVPPIFAASGLGDSNDETEIPVLFGEVSNTGKWWDGTSDNWYLGIDVFGTVFWVLTRLEEVLDRTRDLHDRFAGRSSHAVRARYIDRPVADDTVALLASVMQRLWPGIIPRHTTPRVVPTHDVDRPFKHLFQAPVRLLRTMLGDVARRGDVPSVMRAPSRWIRVRRGADEADPFFTFDWLMERSERAGLRSTFFFICGHSGGHRDGDYDIHHPRMRALLRRIHVRGHEIGLHGSYNSYRSIQVLSDELETLRTVCAEEGVFQERWGGRQHVLRFDSLTTPRVWEAAGLSYDATLGFADVAGFRCGTCHAFPLYDHEGRRTLNVLERPLILMDVTLMSREYEGRTASEAAMRIATLSGACHRAGGQFVLLWHNCQLTAPAWRSVYAATVEDPRCVS